jgi:hypothetical protein
MASEVRKSKKLTNLLQRKQSRRLSNASMESGGTEPITFTRRSTTDANLSFKAEDLKELANICTEMLGELSVSGGQDCGDSFLKQNTIVPSP